MLSAYLPLTDILGICFYSRQLPLSIGGYIPMRSAQLLCIVLSTPVDCMYSWLGLYSASRKPSMLTYRSLRFWPSMYLSRMPSAVSIPGGTQKQSPPKRGALAPCLTSSKTKASYCEARERCKKRRDIQMWIIIYYCNVTWLNQS